MAKRYISNDTRDIMIVGGLLLQPGEGREVEAQFLPPEHQADPAPDAAEAGAVSDAALANLREVLTAKLSVVVPQLADYGDETLATLAKLEGESANPRKTLLGAISQLQLERAAARANKASGADTGTGGEGGEGGEGGAGGAGAGAGT